MPQDIETLKRWITVCLIVAGLCATLIPVLYAFSAWNTSWLGRAFMAYTVAMALVIDTTALFQFWHPINISVLFWINAVMFTLIAASSLFVTAVLWNVNYHKLVRRRNLNEQRSTSTSR